MPEQGVGALGNVPELPPALGCLRVELGGSGVIAGGFGELGLRRGERMPPDGRPRFGAVQRAGVRAARRPG